MTARACTLREGVPIGRTETITGIVNGWHGRTEEGGAISKERLKSREAILEELKVSFIDLTFGVKLRNGLEDDPSSCDELWESGSLRFTRST